MRSGVTAREKERAERATLVQQEKLSKAKVLPGIPATMLPQRCVIAAPAPVHCKHLDFLHGRSTVGLAPCKPADQQLLCNLKTPGRVSK